MKRSTRLVYLHQYYKSTAEVGGIRSHEFAKRLAAAGYDVHVVTTNRGADGQPGWSREDVAGFTVHRIHVPYSNRMSYFARIKAFAKYALTAGLRARALRGDIVFATSTPLTVIIPAWVAKAFRRFPIVFEVRDLWPELPIAVGALRNPVMKWGAGGA